MFRILTVILIIFSGIFFFLTDSQQTPNGRQIEHFDDKIMFDLHYQKRKAIVGSDMAKLKSMYSRDIVTEIITPDGMRHQGGYQGLMELLDDYARTSPAYNEELLSHAIMVADDGLSAVVQMQTIENWRFENSFKDFSNSLIETEHWVLENGVPKIVSIKKEHGSHDAFYLQRQDSSVQVVNQP